MIVSRKKILTKEELETGEEYESCEREKAQLHLLLNK